MSSGNSGQLGQNVPAGEDEEVLTFHGDLGSSILGVDDGVADLDIDRDELPGVFSTASWADGENFALLGLLFGGIGDDQAGRRSGLRAGAASSERASLALISTLGLRVPTIAGLRPRGKSGRYDRSYVSRDHRAPEGGVFVGCSTIPYSGADHRVDGLP
jgi:hypothetical protein